MDVYGILSVCGFFKRATWQHCRRDLALYSILFGGDLAGSMSFFSSLNFRSAGGD